MSQAAEGLGALARHRTVRALAIEATTWNLGNEVFMLALTVSIVAERADGPLALGLVIMAGGVGAFVGASISARCTARFGYGPSLVAALLEGNTAPIVGVVFTQSTATWALIVLGTAFWCSGTGVGIANSQAITVRQLTVPEHLRGRVNAAYRLLSWGSLAIGAMCAGLVATAWGPWTAALVGTALMALSTLPCCSRRMRTLTDDAVRPS